MSLKYKSNLCGGLISIVAAIVLFILIPQQIGVDPSSTSARGITSRTVPYAMAGLILVCGLVLVIQSVVLKKDTVKVLVFAKEGLALVYMLCLILFAFLFKHSFVLATGFLGVATLALLKCKKPLYYVIEIIVILVLFFVFTEFLGVRLPKLFL